MAATGEPLFGSTITALTFELFGLDGNELVFDYTLADGVSGVAEFTAVPEPGTWTPLVLGGAAALGLTLRRRLRRA